MTWRERERRGIEEGRKEVRRKERYIKREELFFNEAVD
jgi:hypothetical protein